MMTRRLLVLLACLVLAGCARSGDETPPAPAPSAPGDAAAATPGRKAIVKVEDLGTDFKPVIGKPGGRLVMSSISAPKSFNPILVKETSSQIVTGFVFSGLTTTNGITLEVEPNLAESWEIAEDGLSYTFQLREGLRWSDGRPLTAADVKFTFDVIYDPEIPNSSADVFSIDGKPFKVEALDERHVRFTLPARFAPFLRGMSQDIIPKHVLEDVWKAGEFNSTWGVNTPPEKLVGSGPYVLEKYRPGERVVLKRNPLYWKKDAAGNQLPYIETIVTMIVKNQDVALLKFQAGELDQYGMRGSDLKILAPEALQENFTIYNAGPALGSSFLVFNQNPGKTDDRTPFVKPYKLKWFRNVVFRRAVSHAIERKAIINTIMNGQGYPQYGPMSVSAGYFYDPDIPRYKYDPKKARELLVAQGFKYVDDELHDDAGRRVAFTLFTNAENTVRVKIANSIRKDLEDVGMRVDFQALEFNLLVSKLQSPPFAWESILLGLTGGVEPHFGQNVWRSTGQLHEWYPQQVTPDTPEEAEVDRIFAEAVQILNRKKRKELYDRWQVIAAEQQWMIYTISPASLSAVRNKFGNLHPTVVGGTFHNLDEIFIKTP